MSKKQYIYSYVLLCYVLFTHTADSTNKSTPWTPEKDWVSLKTLTQLVGYTAAKKLYAVSIRNTTYELFKKIWQGPEDLHKIILCRCKLEFRDIFAFQRYYQQTFKETNLAIKLPTSSIPTIALLNNDTLALASNDAPVQIWSVRNDTSLLFKSNRISSRALCYIPPSLILSASSNTQNLNMLQLSTEMIKDSDSLPIQHTELTDLLFPQNNNPIVCSVEGSIDCYDIEKKSLLFSLIHAHEGMISSGTQYTEHSFVTGGTDSVVRSWDTRTYKSSFRVELNELQIPWAIKRFDEHTLIVGCNRRPALYAIDMRSPITLFSIASNFDKAYSLEVLKDKTLILGENSLYFGHLKNRTIKPVRTIHHTYSVLSSSKTKDDVIAFADGNSEIFLLKPQNHPLYSCTTLLLDTAFIGAAYLEIEDHEAETNTPSAKDNT